MKANDKPLYVHSRSNHPRNILANIPLSVNRRLSSISSNEEIFKSAITPYQEALAESGYKFKLEFEPPSAPRSRKNRSKNITWFIPPFSENIKTNGEEVEKSEPGCNCRAGVASCPFQGQCQKDNVIYRAAVTTTHDGNTEFYTGLTSTTFKNRYGAHKTSIINPKYKSKSALSSNTWKLKSEKKDFNIHWGLLDRAPNFNPTTKKCKLCLKEKCYIMYKPETATLKKRSEFYTACSHRLKGLLINN